MGSWYLFVCFVGLFCFFKLHPLYKQNQRLRNWSRIHTTGLRPVTWKPASNRLISVPPCKIYFPYFETKKVFVIGFYQTLSFYFRLIVREEEGEGELN